MTKAPEAGTVHGRSDPLPSQVQLWVLEQGIAFGHTGGKKSLLSLILCAAVLVRSVAEVREGEAGREKLRKSVAREVAAELFTRSASPMPASTHPQDREPDVVITISDSSVDLFVSQLLVRPELERVACFLLRSCFSMAKTGGVVHSAVEFLRWFEELVLATRSSPLKLGGEK